MSSWEAQKVADLEAGGLVLVQDGNHGEYRPRKEEFIERGIAFIRAADLSGHEIQFSSASKIDDVAFERIRKGVGSDLDTILSTKGTVGKLAFVPKGSPAFVCSPQTTFWRSLDHDTLDPEFLYYELQSSSFRSQAASLKGDTDMADYLSLTSQRSLSIRVPSILEQKEIVRVLSGLDKKIWLNRQINQNLEQIAQAIFKSWFVDFEPVKAKQHIHALGGNDEQTERAAQAVIAGAVNLDVITAAADLSALDQQLVEALSEKLAHQTDAQREQLATTASHFPDQLVESELGLIPEGWDVKQSSDLFEVRDGTHDSPKQSETGKHLITSKHITSGVIDYSKAYLISEEDYEHVNRRSKVDRYDILLTMIGTVGISLLVMDEEVKFAIKNIGLFKTSIDEAMAAYFLLQLRTKQMEQYLESRMAGTTQRYLTLKTLRSIPVLLPSDALMEVVGETFGPVFEGVEANNRNVAALGAARDSLLLKLLSGELKVEKAA